MIKKSWDRWGRVHTAEFYRWCVHDVFSLENKGISTLLTV